MDQNRHHFNQFFSLEALAGLLLFIALLVALVINNSPLAHWYNLIIDFPIHIGLGAFSIAKPLLLWLNDGLMAIFFMLLAMELKREMLEGELKHINNIRLPLIGAIGGIIIPAAIFYLANHHHPHTLKGWPIPTTTDIAFVLGVMALLGKRIPHELRVIMVSLSIVDDVLAISIIAIVFTDHLSLLSLSLAAGCIALLAVMNLAKVSRVSAYIIIGLIMWVCVLKSGVHATLAGVIVGLFIPMQDHSQPRRSPLRQLEHHLHPWVSFVILPLFVFCNGGLSFSGFTWSQLAQPVALGIILGLVLGKPIGVYLLSNLAIKFKFAQLPSTIKQRHLLGLSLLCGIGFTMSLFLTTLAFNLTPYEDIARQAVLFGSFICGGVAVVIFCL